MQINTKFLPLWISAKFILHSSKSKHIRVITLTTLFGLLLGVSSLIIVLSVMNGFTSVAKNRMTNLLPHITIDVFDDYRNLRDRNNLPKKEPITPQESQKKINDIERIVLNRLGPDKIKAMYPNLQKKVFIINNQKLIPIWLQALPSDIIARKLNALNPDYDGNAENINKSKPYYDGIVLSNTIRETLDKSNTISLITPENFFRYYTLQVKNTFTANDQLMANLAFIDIDYAAKIFNDYNVNNINIDLRYPNNAPSHANDLLAEIPLGINNWTNYVGNYFKVLEYTKQIMFILLSCIVIVSMFNLIATLTTVLNEKQSELAILKTLGITRSFIIKLFLTYGFIITSLGLFLGIVLGVVLTMNISYLAATLETIMNYKFINPEIYFINYLPAELSAADIFNIIVTVYTIMLIAIVYPCLKASKIMPALVLRHN